MRKRLEFSAEPYDDAWVYTVSGDLHGTGGGYEFQDDVRERVVTGARKIVVDLSSVNRIDSSGIGILVTVMWSASKAGGGLVLAGLQERVEKVLSIAMLLDHIDHADTVDAALRKLEAMGF